MRHSTVLTTLLQACIDALPPPATPFPGTTSQPGSATASLPQSGAANARATGEVSGAAAGPGQQASAAKDALRRRYLSLVARKATQHMLSVTDRPDESHADALAEAWALHCLAAAEFRRDGWLGLLAHSLQDMQRCAQLQQRNASAMLCGLELAVIAQQPAAAERAALAATSIAQHLQIEGTAKQAQDAAMQFDVDWRELPSRGRPPVGAGPKSARPPSVVPNVDGLADWGWLNVVNVAASCSHSGNANGDVILAVAVRNMLPRGESISSSGAAATAEAASTGAATGAALPLSGIDLIVTSDLGFACLRAAAVHLKPGSAAGVRSSVDGSVTESRRSAETMMRAHSGLESVEELDSLPQHRAAWHEGEAAALGAATPVATNASSHTSVAEGQWAVYALRLRPGDASFVQLQAAHVRFGVRCRVRFAIAALQAARPSAPLLSASPTHTLHAGMVGRDAPFGRMATALTPGQLRLSLGRDVLPDVKVTLTDPVGIMHVGEAVCLEATLTAAAMSSATRALSIVARPRSGSEKESTSLPCQLYIGPSFADAELIEDGRVSLPVLAKGVAHTLYIWIVGEGPCEGDLEVGMSDWPPEAMQLRRWHFEVLEPFTFVAKFTTPEACAVLMRRPDAAAASAPMDTPRSAASTQTSAPVAPPAALHVPARHAVIMTLLATSVVPFPVALERLELGGVPEEWQLQGSSCESLADAPQVRLL